MKKNVGKKDGYIRYIAGIILIILSITLPGMWWLSIIGVILIATSFFGICLFYTILGVDTKETKPDIDESKYRE